MFTGIVEELGEVVAVERLGDSAKLRLRGPRTVPGLADGASIAVNGACLTVADRPAGGDEFVADVMAETLLRTNLGALSAGERVNLERARVLGERLDGHIVQGHVDGTGVVLARSVQPRWHELRVSVPADLARYVAEKGSVAVDGVSLTVVDVDENSFTVCLIPTTLAATTLGAREPGETVNLEVDVIAKYTERLLAGRVAESVAGVDARATA
jgi:riboflavin synthase